MRTRFLARLAVILSLGVLNACYGYQPAEAPVPVGSEIRARLTQETALAESELLGTVTQEYQGRVTEMTEDSLMISVVAARAVGTVSTQAVRRTVRLPLSGIQGISQRSLSRAKTVAAIGVAGVVMVGVIKALGGDVGGQGPGPGPGEPTIRPGFTFSWPF